MLVNLLSFVKDELQNLISGFFCYFIDVFDSGDSVYACVIFFLDLLGILILFIIYIPYFFRHLKRGTSAEVAQSLWSLATALSHNGQLMNC